MKFENAAWVLN